MCASAVSALPERNSGSVKYKKIEECECVCAYMEFERALKIILYFVCIFVLEQHCWVACKLCHVDLLWFCLAFSLVQCKKQVYDIIFCFSISNSLFAVHVRNLNIL